MNKEKKIVINSIFWKTLERSGVQGVQFIVQIVLARLLLPEDYGLVTLIAVFITIANVFVQSGLNMALIQKKDADELDFSSVFYVSLLLATFIYIVLFFVAPFIASFYNQPQLTLMLRVLSLTLFFGAVNSIQNAYVSKNMLFRKLFFSSTGAALFSGILGILLAFNGWGAWALVFQQILTQLITTVILWFTVKWRPILRFSFERVKSLFSYGSRLLITSLLNTLYDNIRSLIIGGDNSAALGFFNRGKQFPEFIVNNIDTSIQSVMLPTLSIYQDDKERVKQIVRRSIMTSSFIIFPMMLGLAAVAEPLVKILLTETWLPAVIFLQIFCFVQLTKPIQTAGTQAIYALGRSDIALKRSAIKKVIGMVVLLCTFPFGVYAIAWGTLVTAVLSVFINMHPNTILFNYNYKEQISDVLPALILSLFMGIIIYVMNFLSISVWLLFILQIIIGISIYLGLAKLFHVKSFEYLLITAKDLMGDRKK